FPQGRRVVAASTGTIRAIVECCIVHDALIAAGSSGGPLLDAQSQVVGINTALTKVEGDRLNESERTFAIKMRFILESLTRLPRAEATPSPVPQRSVPYHDLNPLLAIGGSGLARGKGNPMVVLSTSSGDIKVELYADKAPMTVQNFLDYVKAGYYEGTI